MNDSAISDDVPAISTPEQRTLRNLLFGDDGLRAGWSFLLFVLISALFIFIANFTIRHLHLLPPPVKHLPGSAAEPQSFRAAFVPELSGSIAFLLAALLMSFIEHRPFSRYGLTRDRAFPDFLQGLVWGLLCLSGLIATLVLTRHLAFDAVLLHGSFAVISGIKWLLLFLLVGLEEEFVTRGYIQYTLSRGAAGIARAINPNFRHAHPVGFWTTAFVFSVCLFMGAHLANPGETIPGILAVGVAGAVFAFSLYRTGSLWWAIGIHTSWDWAQSFLYGVPDSGTLTQDHLFATHPIGSSLLSGGATGPEGSIFVLPILAVVALIIHLTLPRRAYPSRRINLLGEDLDSTYA